MSIGLVDFSGHRGRTDGPSMPIGHLLIGAALKTIEFLIRRFIVVFYEYIVNK